MSLTRERIEGLAPDQASLAAALKLVKPAGWPVLAASTGADVLWGECQGSGATPYRVVTTADGGGYKCTCPSRKFPCKHVLAVLWLRVDKPERFEKYRALILQGLASGHLKPVIAKTFTLDQIADAHRYLESNQQVGKVIVTV